MNLLDFLFPKKCVGCNKIGSYFCASCIKEIKQTDLVCPACEKLSIGGRIHPVCERRYSLDGLWSLGIYQDPLKKAIQKLKYKWIIELAQVLSDITMEYWAKYQPLLLEQIKKDQGKNWAVVPVPLHISRQRWRGFNQSALLGKLLTKKMGLKYAEVLKRTKATKPQVKLSSRDRKVNLKDAFSLDSRFLTSDFSILLIDDVWTTGSTLKECCLVLKKAGAKRVWALTLAR